MKRIRDHTCIGVFRGTLIIAIALAAVACTQKRDYEKVDMDPTSQVKPENKGLIDTEAEYLYVPSSLNSTRTTDATFPMYMGDAKIVKLQFDETNLKVVEVEPEDRFNDNPVNEKPVLSIPVEHVDFRCATDANGKCTNVEEEDREKPWVNRNFFKVKADQLAVQEINFLPVEITNLFYPCYQEIGSNFQSFKAEADAINVSIEKIYKSDLACAGNIQSLSDLTFRVVYTYSLAKLNSISTKGYKPFTYQRAEETTFGFFDTRTLKLDRDNNSTVDGEKTLLNRWAPEKTVVYHMTENFNKPENAKIKAATVEAVESINRTLKKSGASLRIDLRDATPNMNPGDLRVNSIVMVEDPVNYGILGYGPTAANPRTGEIVHGRTAMYLGVIKTSLKNAYEELVLEKMSKLAQAKAKVKSQVTVSGGVEPKSSGAGPMSLAPSLQKFTGSRASIDANTYLNIKRAVNAAESANVLLNSDKSHAHGAAVVRASGQVHAPALKSKILARAERRAERRLTVRDAAILKDNPSIREQVLSTHCFMDTEHFNINDAVEAEIDKVITEVGAKPWVELSEAEKDKVIDALLPFVWVPTLIHEIGHNLGLRHNFAGSEDKANFYTKKELADMGVKREFAYSSVMDYGYHSTKELQVMGKYDIAALRFAYAEKLELADGKLVTVDAFRKQPGLQLHEYQFCTDEHADVNPGCNRFDEGSSLVEMAQHWINMYEESYLRRNFRNEQRDFSLYDDATQIRRVGMIMGNLRSMFERYEDIKQTFNLQDEDPIWDEIDFLSDLKQSTRIAGKFFLQVLQTPDTLCAVALKAQPNMIIAVAPLRILSTNAISCMDKENINLLEQYVIVGEAGKSFQSRKDPNSGNPYIDQIDVRGIWINKLLAAQALVGRVTGIESFDEYTGNFLDISDMRDELQGSLAAMLLDQTVAQVPIVTVTGQVLVAEIPVRMYEKEESQNGHKIQKPLHPGVARLFGIPEQGMSFQEKLVDILQTSLPSREQEGDEASLLSSIAARTQVPTGVPLDDFLQTNIGLTRYFVHAKSEVAVQGLILREITKVLESINKAKLEKILEAIVAGQPPAPDATEAEKLAHMLGAEIVDRFLQDGFQSSVFYEHMLQAMAR